MKETHICVLDRDGNIVYEAKVSPARSQPSWVKRRQRNALSLRRGGWQPRSISRKFLAVLPLGKSSETTAGAPRTCTRSELSMMES
jgi:hypothetical protein